MRHTAPDIQAFMHEMPAFRPDPTDIDPSGYAFSVRCGLFLSALIERCREKEIVLFMPPDMPEVVGFGYRNTKDVKVMGDLGPYGGQEMRSGKLIIEGDAMEYPGEKMRGGTLKVSGIAYGDIGEKMEGGTLEVCGEVWGSVGHLMKGGEIILHGSYRELSAHRFGGKIFNHGKEIFF